MPASDQGVGVSSHRFHLVPRVLCFVLAEGMVLLLKGAPDKKIWPGKYNGLGGHVERGETVHAAARREIREEAGLEADVHLRGVVAVDTGEAAGIVLFVFTAAVADRRLPSGEGVSPEGTLAWVPLTRVADVDCVEDLPILLGRLAAMQPGSEPFSACYSYDAHDRLKVEFDEPRATVH